MLTEKDAEHGGVEAEQLEGEEDRHEAGRQAGGDGRHVVDDDGVGPRSVGQQPGPQPPDRVTDPQHRQDQAGLGLGHLHLADRLLVDVHERRVQTYTTADTGIYVRPD